VRIDIFTIFPAIFDGPFSESIIKRAVNAGKVEIHVHDIREFGIGRHRSVDDNPYGGGAGMVMAAPPIFDSLEAVLGDTLGSMPVILTSASGTLFRQADAQRLSEEERIAIICGRYEGVDQRVREHLVTHEYSIGDYVLTGGELPAAVMVDAMTRLIPGVIDPASLAEESHTSGLLEYPQYTRPESFRGWEVPDVLLSGHHARIEDWRRQQAIERTRSVRPDLLESLKDDQDDL
jgi:tRNA (guanine37-N1)-methyltransferase